MESGLVRNGSFPLTNCQSPETPEAFLASSRGDAKNDPLGAGAGAATTWKAAVRLNVVRAAPERIRNNSWSSGILSGSRLLGAGWSEVSVELFG